MNRSDDSPDRSSRETRRWTIGGRVQGVGFRPFVYRLASHLGVRGWVRNRAGEVEVVAQGDAATLADFGRALTRDAPPFARDLQVREEIVAPLSLDTFEVRPSDPSGAQARIVPPDVFVCDDCLRELYDSADRRYRYPFINCTQCGPRYTVIAGLPYDRAETSMHAFPLCAACRTEYENPADRRFHAEPLACPACGPQLQFHSEHVGVIDATAAALNAAVEALRRGDVVAVKGVGGYHLLCDARHDNAIARLRLLKPRPHKPLAVLFPWTGHDGLDAVRRHAELDAIAAQRLREPDRPIVLLPRRPRSDLSPAIAPRLDTLGALLPYSPLHHLLSNDFDGPLVATSANLGGEPVITDNVEIENRLGHVADGFLHHDRPILRPADDGVVRIVAGRARALRLGRGQAPMEFELPVTLAEPTLAVGGHLKNSVALAIGRRAIVSPHLADLDSPRSLDAFAQRIADLEHLYGIRPTQIACDAHPDYASTRWAARQGLPRIPIWHHPAHAAALAVEHPDVTRWLVFAWDGVGLGPDATLWGGEALLGKIGDWQRAASFRPFRLPGGEKAGREPWRSGLALVWEDGDDWPDCPADRVLLRRAWEQQLNAPVTTAAGRLFDAAAALTGLCTHASFEGQGPMMLEALAGEAADPVRLPIESDRDGILRSNWAPLLAVLRDPSRPLAERAARLHASLGQAVVDQACALRARHGDFTLGLTGGVFQNRVLVEDVRERARHAGLDLRLHQRLPCNDGGLCVGQLAEASTRGDSKRSR